MTNSDDAQAPEQPPTPTPEVRPMEPNERIVRANGVDLCAQAFGDSADPPILLIGGSDRRFRDVPEAVRQGAVGWIDDVLRQDRPWPFGLDDIRADVRFRHGEDDTLAPLQYAKELAEGMPESRLRLYPGEGHISILDGPIKEIVEILLAP